MTFTTVPVIPDTPEWEQERRNSLGASEVPGVLGLSPYGQTRRTIYRNKLGITTDEFDKERAFIGHESEKAMSAWLRQFHPEVGDIRPAAMVRSVEYPWLHASLDRIALKGDVRVPVQMKTAHYFPGKEWEDGVPSAVQLQIQTEMLVFGAPYAWAVCFTGAMKYYLYRVEADPMVQDQIIRITGDFWNEHILAKVEPAATLMSEFDESKTNTGKTVAGDERLLMAWYLDGLERSAYKGAEEQIEAVKAAYKELLTDADADELTYSGRSLYTWKRSKDVLSFDRAAFEREHPELVAQYTRLVPGSMRFLRKTVKDFEENPPENWEPGLTVLDVLASYDDLGAWRQLVKS